MLDQGHNNFTIRVDFEAPPRSLLITFSVLLCCLWIASTGVNIICFALFTKKRELLGNQANKLVFNFIISTLSTSIILMPASFISYASNEWIFTEFVCQTTGLFSITMPLAQLLTLGSMAYDRYHYIVNPLTYPINMTSFKTNVLIFFIWLVSIVSGLLPLFGWSAYKINLDVMTCTVWWTASPSFAVYFFIIAFVVPLFVQLYCYAGIIKVARKQAKFGRRLSRVAVVPVQVTRIIKETSASKTIHKTCFIIGLFLFTWMPYVLLALIQGTSRVAHLRVHLFIACSVSYVSSLVYPILFVFRSKTLKKDVRIFLRHSFSFLCVNYVAPEEVESSVREGRRKSSVSLDGYDLNHRRRSSRMSKVSWAMPMVIEDGQELSVGPRPSITTSTLTTDAYSLYHGTLLPGEPDYSCTDKSNS